MQVADILDEYFLSGDVDEVAHQLQDASLPHFEWAFVKKAITAAMDRHEREREMTSVLLSSLYDEVICCSHIPQSNHFLSRLKPFASRLLLGN